MHWLGELQGDDKWGAFFASDALSLPSHEEGGAVAVVEALACGVPVLISNKVDVWREIEDGAAGWVGEDTIGGTLSTLQHWLWHRIESPAMDLGLAKA